MTITIEQLFMIQDSGALERLAQKEIPIAQSFRVARLLREVRNEFRDANNQRAKLFTKENSVSIEGTGLLQLKPEFEEQYRAALEPLLKTKVSITAADPINISELGSILISSADMACLLPIIQEANGSAKLQPQTPKHRGKKT